MADWNALVESYFLQKKTLTYDIVDTLIGEFLDREVNFLDEASKRGVAHPDKMGKPITDKDGRSMTLSDFGFIQVGDEGIDDLEALQQRVEDTVAQNKAELLYRFPQNLSARYKAAIIVLADEGGKKFAFVKYTSGNPMWREVDFFKETGFSIKGTQSSKEILALGPQTLIASEDEIALNRLPEVVINNAKGADGVSPTFTESLPAFFESVYAKGQPSPLRFDSAEAADQSLSSVNKYFGEIMAPALLGIGHMLQPDAVIADAQKNLLEPFGLTWADSTGVSYPQAPQNPLVDSYLHLGDRVIGVSSKSGAGANPSVKNLYAMIFEEANDEQRQQLRSAGYGDYIDMVKLLVESSAKLGPIKVAITLGILTEAEAQEAIDVINNKVSMQEVNVSAKLNQVSSFHTPIRGVKMGVNDVKSMDEASMAKLVRTYTPANHVIAGIAKAVAATINSQESEQGGKKFTAFGKAVFNFSTMVQIYGKFKKSGDSEIGMQDFRIIYPPNFDGEMLLNAGKGYTSSGQNDKLTVKLK